MYIKYILPLATSIFLINGCGSSSSSEETDSETSAISSDLNSVYTFKEEESDGTLVNTEATLKSKVTVDTKYGQKTLLVWVSNNTFGEDCIKEKCITQDMVDELQLQFLKEGDNNDIYDWVTNVYGEEWSQSAYDKYPSDLIQESDEINILFTDIDNDNNPSGGVMGYFYSKDNFQRSSEPNSNEMIMFYVDSVMFANDEGDGFWQKEMYSTLAHEFQHMIHFYQKRILLNADDDVWINELLSETTEDLIATKIEHIGPRGVSPYDGSAGDENNTNGRYPYFNLYNDISLTAWRGQLYNYSNVNAFGAYLTRNYNGADILHKILYNDKEHEDTIEYATGKDFAILLQEWGEAVILSSIENPDDLPTYNFGDFKDISYNGITYNLGSIDFFNYSPQPFFHDLSEGTDISIYPSSNTYYIVGEDLTGDIDLSIDLGDKLKALLISIDKENNSYNVSNIMSGEHTISLDSKADLYLVVTNIDLSQFQTVSIDHNAKYTKKSSRTYKIVSPYSDIKKAPSFVTYFNNNVSLHKK